MKTYTIGGPEPIRLSPLEQVVGFGSGGGDLDPEKEWRAHWTIAAVAGLSAGEITTSGRGAGLDDFFSLARIIVFDADIPTVGPDRVRIGDLVRLPGYAITNPGNPPEVSTISGVFTDLSGYCGTVPGDSRVLTFGNPPRFDKVNGLSDDVPNVFQVDIEVTGGTGISDPSNTVLSYTTNNICQNIGGPTNRRYTTNNV